eukprot:1335796-Pleurochrysis_carterae.AAC.1
MLERRKREGEQGGQRSVYAQRQVVHNSTSERRLVNKWAFGPLGKSSQVEIFTSFGAFDL